MQTTPPEVTTKLGLQPRSFVVVKTLGVTRSSSSVAVAMSWWPPGGRRGPARRSRSLAGGEAAVDPEDLAGNERSGIGAEEDGRADDVTSLPDAAQGDAVDDPG